MGNRTSQAAPDEAPSAQVTEDASGVFISQSLLSDAVNDFNSTVLREEWEKQQKYFLARGSNRRMEDLKREEDLKQHMAHFRLENSKIQAQLDETIDDARAKFSDTNLELEHTMRIIEQKHSKKMSFEEKKPCLQERANVSMCLKQDANSCNDFVEVLDRCVLRTLVEDSQ